VRKTTLELHPGMGPAVLQHLSRFTDLDGLLARYPGAAEGFVAGQAVASAVSELFHDGLAIAYNDVDVFILSERFERAQSQVLTTLDFDQATLGVQYRQLTVELTTVYEVCHTQRHGMLNEVRCRPIVNFKRYPARASQAFLQSFDLNCVQVGVRLSDGALCWTSAFEQFLATRQMLVASVKTPVHTAIRWLRKKAELEGVFGHDDHAMELLSAVRTRIGQQVTSAAEFTSWHRTLSARLQFGPGYLAKAQAVASSLGKYFELQSVPQARISLYTLSPRGHLNDELVKAEVVDHALPTYARALQGHWKRHVCGQLLEHFRAAAQRRGAMYQRVQVEGVAAVAALRSKRDANRLDKAVKEHAGLAPAMLCLSTPQLLALVDALDTIAVEQGLWVWGVFEQLEQAGFAELAGSTPANMLDTVRKLMADTHRALELVLAKRKHPLKALLPAVEFEGFRIEELTSFKELAHETARLHHCVAGYWHSVVSDQCRIIRLSKHRVQESLTMELVRRGRGWHNCQLRGLHNRQSTTAEIEVAERYVDMANLQSLAGSVGLQLPRPIVLGVARGAPLAMRMLRTLVTDGVGRSNLRVARRLRPLKPLVVRWLGGELMLSAAAEGARLPYSEAMNWRAWLKVLPPLAGARLALLVGKITPAEATRQIGEALAGARTAAHGVVDFADDLPF
jgi:hypothetical protein